MGLTSRRYYSFFKMDSDDVVLLEERLTAVLNHITREGERVKSGVDGNPFAVILERGIESYEGDMGADLVEDDNSVIARKLRGLRLDTAKNRSLAAIYEAVGLDNFVKFCEENNITDWAGALEDYNTELFETKAKAPWSEKASEWLEEFLGDGVPHPIGEVKDEAIKSGIIEDTSERTVDRDWNKLKVLASRRGFSSKGARGQWEG